MFTDPITLTPGASFDAGAVSLPRVSQQGAISVYQAGPLTVNAGSLLRVSASHQYGKRTRRVLRCDYSDNAGSTLISGTTAPRSMSCYVVFDIPSAGQFSATDQLSLFNGLKGTWSATTDTLMKKVLGGES
ncbi:coat protein [ssRNA phage Zoerhiza.2_6]|uniref:Coat protein n=2 Tax=Leviviricetes TaxID=2842243 RepID=A0A8S5L4B0_9VIRU|nr:coat protein [ssRNA phage Zoerhiza.2_6]QDH86637.1 MAG: hypothetical protein H3RhizoL15367e6041_000002 [Leviviridae sp.]QDH86954.1 MAG: hypothetical protein H2Rhizo31527_000002 [Leviviridae sp.]DAD52173.1 TPA_asm: coat protein [ssRNA phage Zoerhiza.2_6]